MTQPPLSLYIHIPWCVQKCPYCDFNSHGLKNSIPEAEYVQHLLADLKEEAVHAHNRPISTIFIGGGTPSLLSEKAIGDLLEGANRIIPFASDIEITLEANPGTLEANRFIGYANAGVNRLSIGVQSMQADKLKSLGRIHNADEAKRAADFAHQSGVKSFNLDLMHGLPGQSLEDAMYDLEQVIALNPHHLSWYQLTIEPNTQFHSKPPTLPVDDTLWQIQESGLELIQNAGFKQYEISGYAKNDLKCRHNLNYWRFGDYLGIGCGAHGKVTLPNGSIMRRVKIKHPKGYMDLTKPYLFKAWQVADDDLPFEFFMNRLRLMEPCPKSDFTALTGLQDATVADAFAVGFQKGMLRDLGEQWQVTEHGHRYLNDLLELFV